MEVITKKATVLIFSPALNAVSGVATHANMLLNSTLSNHFNLLHFQVGSEGKGENAAQRVMRFLTSPVALALVLIKHRPQIVHINTSMNLKAFWRDLTYLIVARLLKRRVVTQVHSGSSPAGLFSKHFFARFLRYFLMHSDVVPVLSSEAMRGHKTFDTRINAVLVPNAIETFGLLDVPRTTFAPGQPVRLVYVGRIVRSKGLFDVLQALEILKTEELSFQLMIAGTGPDFAEVKATIEHLGLANDVQLLGPIFGAAKNQLWLHSDIQVFPTFHNEGLPYSILESLAAGCVPITCPVAAIPDVMTDGIHGLFVAPHDPAALASAIRRLAMNRDELRQMAEAGRQRVGEEYTVDRLAGRFDSIYSKLLT